MTSTLASRDLEGVLHNSIPLTRDLGMTVISWETRQLRLHLPLAQNINHQSTMFGGSLYCGAVLAGWGWLYLRLKEAEIHDGHIVIQEGQISYPMPVGGDGIATCDAPDEARWNRFVEIYKRRGRARLALQTRITSPESDEAAVKFLGHYVLHR